MLEQSFTKCHTAGEFSNGTGGGIEPNDFDMMTNYYVNTLDT